MPEKRNPFTLTFGKRPNRLVLRREMTEQIVDDFLAEGEAMHALIDIAHQAGATVSGIGIAVEKSNQKGGEELRREGFRVESIAIIEEMNYDTQTIRFKA